MGWQLLKRSEKHYQRGDYLSNAALAAGPAFALGIAGFVACSAMGNIPGAIVVGAAFGLVGAATSIVSAAAMPQQRRHWGAVALGFVVGASAGTFGTAKLIPKEKALQETHIIQRNYLSSAASPAKTFAQVSGAVTPVAAVVTTTQPKPPIFSQNFS